VVALATKAHDVGAPPPDAEAALLAPTALGEVFDAEAARHSTARWVSPATRAGRALGSPTLAGTQSAIDLTPAA
jgi:hypothetical protein